MRKILSIVLVAVLCLSLSVSSFASENNDIPTYLNNFVHGRDPNATILQVVPMYDTNQNVNSWLFILSPQGYIITDNSKEIVVEFSFCNDFEYNGEAVYFAGPTQYFTKSGDYYSNVKSNSLLTGEELEIKVETFATLTSEMVIDDKEPSTLSDVATLSAGTLDKDDFPLYSYNNDGRCGYAVVTDDEGNVLEYLDVEVTSEIVSISRAIGTTYSVTYSASYKTDSGTTSLSGVVATATVTWNDVLGMKNELVSVNGGWTVNGETLCNRKVSYGSKSFFGETYTETKNPTSNSFYYSPSNITGYTLYVNTKATIDSTGKTISLYVKSKITT